MPTPGTASGRCLARRASDRVRIFSREGREGIEKKRRAIRKPPPARWVQAGCQLLFLLSRSSRPSRETTSKLDSNATISSTLAASFGRVSGRHGTPQTSLDFIEFARSCRATMNHRKLLRDILASPGNVRFRRMVALVEGFGFRLSRTRGSHHIFAHPDVAELVNLQNVKGQAKAYQVRQFLRLVERYNLNLEGD